MTVQLSTIKRLYAKSSNQCALPKCEAPIIVNDIPVGEICHIRARRKKGPRYDPSLTAQDRDAYSNLLLLCRTCHKLIDSDPGTYTSELLSEIKQMHEAKGHCEITPKTEHYAALLLEAQKNKRQASAKASGKGVAIAVVGDVNAPITVGGQARAQRQQTSKYPANAIGADANMAGYIDFLFGLALDYWKNIETMPRPSWQEDKTKIPNEI